MPSVWVSFKSLEAAPSSSQQEADVKLKRMKYKAFVRMLEKMRMQCLKCFLKTVTNLLPEAVLTTRKEDFDHPMALCAVNSI